MKAIYFIFCTIATVVIVAGPLDSFAAGNPFESNIKTDPTALVLGDVIPGSGVSSLSVEPGQRWYFDSGETVVDQDVPQLQQYGAVFSSPFESATYYGRSWQASPFFTLDSGETKEFLVQSPGSDTVVYTQFKIPSTTGETLYEVLRDPVVSDEGRVVRPRSFNPDVQDNGGYEFRYTVHEDPTYTGGILSPDSTERWGSGKKEGGSGGLGVFRIGPADKDFIIRITSFGNSNYIKFVVLVYEHDKE